MSANVQAALDDAGKVVKRQRVCATNSEQCLDKIIQLVEGAKTSLIAGSSDAIPDLLTSVERLTLTKDLNSHTKDLHSAINKLSKSLDRVFDTLATQDVCKALRPEVHLERTTLLSVLAQHLLREGRFEVAQKLVVEAGLPGGEALAAPYQEMHRVLQEIRSHNLEPALHWAVTQRAQLSPDGSCPSDFEFKLHELRFLHLLNEGGGGRDGALAYARANFQPFHFSHMRDIQRLMGCLLYAGRPPHETPYADLLTSDLWTQVEQEFVRQACSLLGQASESPLVVTVAAGAAALPALLKLASLMERKGQKLAAGEQLPIELELGPEFVFHSIFACPVSREQGSASNPPKLLPCNHVLCEQSILRIAKSRTRVFKCPYCPMEARADNTRELVFPDAA